MLEARAVNARSSLPGAPPCPECQSYQVRPSQSSYPLDRAKNPEGRLDFWRCSHCGARFMGPRTPESRQARRHSRGDSLERRLSASRRAKRWIFPVIVLILTALAVTLILDRRNRDPRPALVLPGSRPANR